MPDNDKDPVLRIERKLAIINEGGVTNQIKYDIITMTMKLLIITVHIIAYNDESLLFPIV